MERADGRPRRTDPLTFAVTGLSAIPQLAIPLAFAGYSIFDEDSADLLFIAAAALVLIGFIFLAGYIQWRRFTYIVGADDIRVESGVLSRAARSVPYDRIQDVSLEQKLVPRLFDLVEVRFETGAGGKDEIALRYLPESEGERLRELVRSQKAGLSTIGVADEINSVETPAEPSRELFAMPPKRVFTFGLFEFSLAVIAVLVGLTQQFEAFLPFDFWDDDFWREQLTGPGAELAAMGRVAQALAILAAVASFLVLGVMTGIVRTTLREWDFTLLRTDKGLRRRRGLLTRTDVVMPIHRIQALRITTQLVRNWFGWKKLSLVSLAQDAGGSNHDAAPFAKLSEIEPIVREAGFALPDAQVDWQRGAKAYHVDRWLMWALLLVPLAIGLGVTLRWWLALPILALLAVPALVEAYNWRFAANGLDERQVYVRRSKLAPKLAICTRTRLQSVELRQGPLSRLRGYCVVELGLAGGRFRLHGIPLQRARAIREHVLVAMQGTDFSRLI